VDPNRIPLRSARRPVARRRAAIALVLAALPALAGCGVVARGLREAATGYETPSSPDLARAEAAWAYFASGRNPATGLVPTVGGANFTTAWTMGDQVAALVAARRFGLIDERAFDAQFSQLLQTLNTMPLSGGALPGKVHAVDTGRLVDFEGRPADLGWSAVDVGRLLVWLRIAADRHPAYAPYIANAAARWNVCAVTDERGRLQAADRVAEGERRRPESARGYDAYAVQGYRAWGLAVPQPPMPPRDAEIDIQGVAFPLPADPDAAPLITAPHALLGMEFDWRSPDGAPLAAERALVETLYRVQEARHDGEGILTARSDFRRSGEPYQLVDAVLARGYPWSTATPDGKAHPRLALVSTQAALGMDALWRTPYTARLAEAVAPLNDPGAGWFEGRYEASGGYEWTRTAATNAFVLETLLFEAAGPLYPRDPAPLRPATADSPVPRDCRLPALR